MGVYKPCYLSSKTNRFTCSQVYLDWDWFMSIIHVMSVDDLVAVVVLLDAYDTQ